VQSLPAIAVLLCQRHLTSLWPGTLAALVLTVLAVTACVVERPVPIPTSLPSDCGGTGTEPMRLEGDPDREPPIWLVGVDSGRRYNVVWPNGYSADLGPPFGLRNRLGETIARQGDILEIEGEEMSVGAVSICSILAVNQASPPPEPIPTAVPVPSPRPWNAPPPVGMGFMELEVCGETDEGVEPIDSFVVRFLPLEGQPGKTFRIAADDCEKREYRVPGGRFVVEVSAPGWQTYRTDINILPGTVTSGGMGIALRPEPTASPDS
jgi:hypothetical protein